MKMVVRTEPCNPANHVCPGDATVKQVIQNGRIDGVAVIVVILAYVNAYLFCRSRFEQGASS